jgi:hypothetical protein
MRILLFTVLNCVACDKHRRAMIELTKDLDVGLNIYNIDDPRYLNMALKAMQLYDIMKTPSSVLLDADNKLIVTIQGIPNSLEKLTHKINEKRSSN